MSISVMAIRDVVEGSMAALAIGQTIGVFLRALEDKFTVRKSVRIVIQIWALYFLYLAVPFKIIWDIWAKPGSWSIEMYLTRQIRMSILTLIMGYPFIIWKCTKRATAVYSLNTPHPVDKRPTLIGLAETPVRYEITQLAMSY